MHRQELTPKVGRKKLRTLRPHGQYTPRHQGEILKPRYRPIDPTDAVAATPYERVYQAQGPIDRSVARTFPGAGPLPRNTRPPGRRTHGPKTAPPYTTPQARDSPAYHLPENNGRGARAAAVHHDGGKPRNNTQLAPLNHPRPEVTEQTTRRTAQPPSPHPPCPDTITAPKPQAPRQLNHTRPLPHPRHRTTPHGGTAKNPSTIGACVQHPGAYTHMDVENTTRSCHKTTTRPSPPPLHGPRATRDTRLRKTCRSHCLSRGRTPHLHTPRQPATTRLAGRTPGDTAHTNAPGWHNEGAGRRTQATVKKTAHKSAAKPNERTHSAQPLRN